MAIGSILLGGAFLAASLVLTINHLIPFKGYVFGNAEVFTGVAEVLIIWQTIISAGSITALMMNSAAGLFIGIMLAFGRYLYGGKKLSWNWKDRSNGKAGFSTEIIDAKANLETLPEIIVSSFSFVFGGVITVLSGIWSIISLKYFGESATV